MRDGKTIRETYGVIIKTFVAHNDDNWCDVFVKDWTPLVYVITSIGRDARPRGVVRVIKILFTRLQQ